MVKDIDTHTQTQTQSQIQTHRHSHIDTGTETPPMNRTLWSHEMAIIRAELLQTRKDAPGRLSGSENVRSVYKC